MNKSTKPAETVRVFLSFALIPLSGFATDIYLPSLPSMTKELHVSGTAIQFTLVSFMIAYGAGQFVVGSLIDSFGRFRLGIASMILFSMASFAIALSKDIGLINAMRIVQGVTAALVVVSKRAYFLDTYQGSRLTNYVSLFSIAWSAAPIIAPFAGGYLQSAFGWTSNFYLLGFYTIVLLIIELIWGRESLTHFLPFKARDIAGAYAHMLKTTDFSIGLIIISLNYAFLVVYNMSSPFIIEHVFSMSAIVTGYCSLISGISFMTGGILSKLMIKKDFLKKISTGIFLQICISGIMIIVTGYATNIYLLVGFTAGIHLLSGFIFNNAFAYCLGRFTGHAGISSGITGGALFTLTSLFSYGLVSVLPITSQLVLGVTYLIFSITTFLFLLFFSRARRALLVPTQ